MVECTFFFASKTSSFSRASTQGYGEWVQLSVFQCQLTSTRYAQLLADCDELIHHGQDHIVIIDVGTAEWLEPRIVSLGKRKVAPVNREVVIV
ncbi:MAG: CRISPR-associated endonuclease Cas2 [Gammaproteobacteria bacterium]|nr:CRISPR-associated endonuclease Cas2 [Gammaproteobacteria bacterium]